VGYGEQRTGCNVPFHSADRSRRSESVRYRNVIRCPWGCLAMTQIEARANRTAKSICSLSRAIRKVCARVSPDRVPSICSSLHETQLMSKLDKLSETLAEESLGIPEEARKDEIALRPCS
jgi:hypothetical protein